MSTDTLAARHDQAVRALSDGQVAASLALAAALVADHPADPRGYRIAAQALIAGVALPEAPAALDPARKDRLYRQLLLQADCPARPFLLHEEVVGLPHGVPGLQSLVTELAPTITALLAEGPPTKPLLLFLLVMREHVGALITQEDLTRLHLTAFPEFAERDFPLPYSVMFRADLFDRNRRDLIERWRADGPAFLDRLRPHHLPLLSWLDGGWPLFADPVALARWLDRAGEPIDDSDRRAARAMLLAEGGVEPGPDARARLGIDDATLAEAKTLNGTRRSHRTAQGDGAGAAARLESRPWMAVHAARTLVARHVPFIARRERRIRVAICVSGQLRGYHAALPTWRRTFLAQADTTIFVHSWRAIGRGPAQAWRVVLPFSGVAFTEAYRRLVTQEGLETFEARYPAFYRALGTTDTVTAAQLQEEYRTPHVVVDDEADPRFAGFTNPQKMHYKIRAISDLVDASGDTFDLVMRIRPDLEVRNQAFHWGDMVAAAHAAPCLYTDRPLSVSHAVPMIGDQVAIGAPDTMARYAATWDDYPRRAALDLAGASPGLLGHVSLAQNCWWQGIAVRRVPLRFGRLLEPQPFGSDAILAMIHTDAAGRMDAIDRALIEAAQTDRAGG